MGRTIPRRELARPKSSRPKVKADVEAEVPAVNPQVEGGLKVSVKEGEIRNVIGSTGSIKLDWEAPLPEAGDRGWELLLEASSHQFKQDSQEDVIQSLKFLATNSGQLLPFGLNNSLGGGGELIYECACTRYAPFSAADCEVDFKPELLLTDAGALAGCEHYIAITYCWQQLAATEDSDIRLQSPAGYRITTASGVRDNKAPATVIHRAISYAAAHGYRLIWIDQECIEQDDSAEKERTIQAMHRIYRQAEQTVALLTNPILDQGHLDIFDSLGRADGHKAFITELWGDKNKRLFESFDFYKRGVELTEIIAADLWYSRAWTLQESLISGGPLHLLMPYLPSLQKPEWLGSIDSQLTISESFISTCLKQAFFANLESQANRTLLDRTYDDLCTRASRTKDILLAWIPEYKMTQDIKERPELARLSALDVCGLLFDRGILEPSDLIAIIGNLCQYKIRLNTHSIRKANLSFSICALTLSFLNGDMSLFLGLDFCTLSPTIPWRVADALSTSSLMVGIETSQRGSEDTCSARSPICRIHPPILTSSGPVLSGTLWDCELNLDFTDIRDLFMERWNNEGATYR